MKKILITILHSICFYIAYNIFINDITIKAYVGLELLIGLTMFSSLFVKSKLLKSE